MLWNWPSSRSANLWGEFDRLQREMNRLFEPPARTSDVGRAGFPPVNIWSNSEDALLTAELPGVDPESIDVTVKDDTVTVRGTRPSEELPEGENYIRRERGSGTFVRSFALPFHVDADSVEARYRLGILEVRLPRREEDKPKKITVKGG
jgi:HSP20 family protein